MKAYLSYSSKGYRKEINSNIINLHKVCFFYLKKHFKEVHLLTDSLSKDFFLDIPWASISSDLDLVPSGYSDVWSLSKLKAYEIIAKKGDPFIHVDNDVILWNILPKRILESEVFCQCPEDIIDHEYQIKKFIKNCPNKSIFKHIQYPLVSYNLGIFGGKNLDFISEYAKSAQDFVFEKDNTDFWLNFDGYNNSWAKATLAEQYFLSGFSIYKNKKIECLFPEWPSEDMASEQGYTHLMLAKNDPKIQAKIESMAEEYSKSFSAL